MSAEAPRGITITSSRSPELLLDAEAVVFDCDGLLVDSESVWLELIAEQHRRLGLSATAAVEAAGQFRGLDVGDAAARLASRSRETQPVAALRDVLVEDYSARLAAGVTPMPGAVSLVRALVGRVPVAVASNGLRADVAAMLADVGLLELVDVVRTLDDVDAAKPAPDVYLAAARALDVDPSRTVAFEDSVAGAEAARAAGMTVVGVDAGEATMPCSHRIDSLVGLDVLPTRPTDPTRSADRSARSLEETMPVTALTAETDRPTLRLISWNLWFGGAEVEDGRHKQVDVLREQQADLLFLQECWGDAGGRLGRTLGMTVAQQSWDNAVLSTGPAQLLTTDTAPYATAAVVGTAAGQVLAWSVHLAPEDYGPYRADELPAASKTVFAQSGEVARDRQAQRVLEETDRLLEQHGSMPVIIAGDFNVPSAVDWDGGDRPAVDWPATRRLVDAGYADAFRTVHPDPRRAPGRSWAQIHTLDDEPRDRIDFVYVRGLDVLAADHLGGAADAEDAPADEGFVEFGGVCRHIPDHQDNDFPSDHLAVRAVLAAE